MNLQGNYDGWSHANQCYVFSVLGKLGEIQKFITHLRTAGIAFKIDDTGWPINAPNPQGYALVDFAIDPKDATYLRMLCQG